MCHKLPSLNPPTGFSWVDRGDLRILVLALRLRFPTMERDAIMLLFQFHRLASHELAGDALSQLSRQHFIDNPNLLPDIVPGPY